MIHSMRKGIFTISLDLELHWGVFSRLKVKQYQGNLEGTREGVRETLKVFNKHKIHATWATVGFLFCKNKEELVGFSPNLKPQYTNWSFDPYALIKEIGNSEIEAPFHFGASIIYEISECPGQEIATHTYSHYFCLEDGQNIEQFEADIAAAVDVAKKMKFSLKSIVFPRNQVNEPYLEVCRKYGVTNWRGNPQAFIYKARNRGEEMKWIRALRLIDAYFNVSGSNGQIVSSKNGVVNIPASRFLRPYSPKFSVIDFLKIRRIKREMTHAAKHGKVYHLWWHPHNFGNQIEKNIKALDEILSHYSYLNKNYKFQTLNMEEIGQLKINE